jgi:hypothetical protein
MAVEFTTLSNIISGVISILVVSIFIHFGAKPFAEEINEKFSNAIIVAVAGSVLASLAAILLSGVFTKPIYGQLLSVAAWALVAAAIYHVSWVKGLLIGLVAGILWFIVNLVMAAIGL